MPTYALGRRILPLAAGHARDRHVTSGLHYQLVFAANASVYDVAAELCRVVNAHRVLDIRWLATIDRFVCVYALYVTRLLTVSWKPKEGPLTFACRFAPRPLAIEAALAQIVTSLSDPKAWHALVLDDTRVEDISAFDDAVLYFLGFAAIRPLNTCRHVHRMPSTISVK